MGYLLDSDVFIRAKRVHYGFDFCPAFWDFLIREHDLGVVFSIEKVREELLVGGDDLSEWVEQHARLFLPLVGEDVASIRAVSDWIDEHEYEEQEKDIFFDGTDHHLVAQAFTSGHAVVTHETRAPSSRKIKIPDVCAGLDIECITPFQVLRRQRARFILH